MEEIKDLNEVVEEPKKEEVKEEKKTTTKKASTGTKKTSSTKSKTEGSKSSSVKKSSTGTKKTSAAKKEIKNPLDDMPVVKKKASGATSIEKALEKKVSEKTETNDNSKEDMKSRMQRIINASKKLNDSILEEDTKKAQMKEKLANAAQEMEAEYGAVEEDEKSVADTYSEKNAKLKGKYDDLSKKLAAMMAESNLYSEEEFEEDEKTTEVVQDEVKTETVAEVEPRQEEVKAETVVEVESSQEETKVEQVQPVQDETEVEEVKTPQEDLSSQIVLDLVKEHREEQAEIQTAEEQQENEVKEIIKQEIIDTSIPELIEKPVSKNSVLKKFWDYVIKTMNGMAYGLFATLIIGTIIGTIAGFLADGSTAKELLNQLATLLKNSTGLGIGVGIAWSLKYDGIKLISIASAGAIAAYFCYNLGTKGHCVNQTGDPLTIYLVVIATSVLMSQIFRKKTPVDIIIIPLFTSLVSAALTYLVSEYVVMVTKALSDYIAIATEYQPLLMGIVIAVIMGMALTAPISSAAIASIVFVGTEGAITIAGGAALIGCCTQMLGFAIMSRKDNGFGTCLAIGVGTSMLQFKNILKKPVIWLPTIIASAILGALSTTLINLECMGVAAGMGTSGLVGMVGTISEMGTDPKIWMIILGFEIVAPLVLVFILDIIFRKLKWIKEGDLKL